MNIRPATAEDAPAIAHIHVTAWQATYKGIVPELYLSSLNEAATLAAPHNETSLS